jgi:hypothetical protein
VLCASLRLLSFEVDEDNPQVVTQQENAELRHVITQEIARRLTGSYRGGSWSDCDLLLAGVRFTDADFNKCTFRGHVTFESAVFDGTSTDFTGATFEDGRTDFTNAEFSASGLTSFAETRYTGASVHFSGSGFKRVGNNTLSFQRARFVTGTVYFKNTHIETELVTFNGATFRTNVLIQGQALGPAPLVENVTVAQMRWVTEDQVIPKLIGGLTLLAPTIGEAAPSSPAMPRVWFRDVKFEKQVFWDQQWAPSTWPTDAPAGSAADPT